MLFHVMGQPTVTPETTVTPVSFEQGSAGWLPVNRVVAGVAAVAMAAMELMGSFRGLLESTWFELLGRHTAFGLRQLAAHVHLPIWYLPPILWPVQLPDGCPLSKQPLYVRPLQLFTVALGRKSLTDSRELVELAAQADWLQARPTPVRIPYGTFPMSQVAFRGITGPTLRALFKSLISCDSP